MDMVTTRGCKTVAQFNELYPEEAKPLLVLVFDELGLIMGHDDRKLVRAATAALNAILATSRSAGGHAILCTQRPSADVIAPYIKANAAGRICFAVPGNMDSIVVIDSGAASKIDRDIPGRAILSVGPWLAEIQSPKITDHQIAEIIKAARNEHVSIIRHAAMTIDDVLRLSVREFGGQLESNKMFDKVRGRISRDELKALVKELNGGQYIVDGIAYAVQNKGRGKHGGKRLRRIAGDTRTSQLSRLLRGAMPNGVKGESIVPVVVDSPIEHVKG
jgi:DNA segregation ATPase FtsK/SpoIIIE-like protein